MAIDCERSGPGNRFRERGSISIRLDRTDIPGLESLIKKAQASNGRKIGASIQQACGKSRKMAGQDI